MSVRLAAIAIAALASVLVAGSAPAQIPGEGANGGGKAQRRHSDGPLTEKDFKAQPPGEGRLIVSPFRASVYLDISWSNQYRTIIRGRSVTAQLTQFEAWGVCDPSKSWNRWAKQDPDLLDHEQGHLDVVEIHARRLEVKMRKLLAARKPLLGQGSSEAAAIEALSALLQKEYVVAKTAADEENNEYDKLTMHGTILEKQAELRHLQQETLKKLEEELKGLKKK